MRHHDELRLRAHFGDQLREAPHVGFVERRIHFVQDAEGARLVAENGDEQRQRGHGFFSAAQQQHVLQPLARRRSHHVDACVAGAVHFRQPHLRHATAKNRVKRSREICVDGMKSLLEFLPGDLVQLRDGLLRVANGLQ